MIIANKRLFNDRLSSIFIIAIVLFGRVALADGSTDKIAAAANKTSGLSDKQLDQIKEFLKTMSRLIGFALIFMSIHSLKKFGQQSAMIQNSGASILGPFIKLFIGVLLIRPDQFIDVFYMSIWNYNQDEALNKAYSDPYGIIKNLWPKYLP